MSKKSRRQSRRNRKPRAQREAKGFFGRAWPKLRARLTIVGIIQITITLIGIVSAYVGILGFWLPRISVQALEMNSRDALSSEFSVTNQGYTSIQSVAIGYNFRNFSLREYSKRAGNADNEVPYVVVRRKDGTEPKEPQLGDIAESIPLSGFYDNIPPLRSATMKIPLSMLEEEDLDIEIIVHYRPAWYPFARRESFRFITKVSSDGEIHWVPRPDLGSDLTLPPPPQNRRG